MLTRSTTRFAIWVEILISLLIAPVIAAASPNEAGQQILASTGFTLEQIHALRDDPLVVEVDVPDSSRQAAFAGLIRITGEGDSLFRTDANDSAPALMTPQLFGYFSAPTATGDLSNLKLATDDYEVLEECRPAACRFKLDARGIEKAQATNWSQRDAPQRFLKWFRGALDSDVSRYRTLGLQGLITYADKQTPYPVAQGVTKLEQQTAPLLGLYPALRGYLGSYPEHRPDNLSERLVWSISDFGYRPTLSVDHVIVDNGAEGNGLRSAMILRTIYANHYLAGRLQLGGVIDGQTVFGVAGHFVLAVDQILFDAELGRFKRSLLGRGLKSNVSKRLENLKGAAQAGG